MRNEVQALKNSGIIYIYRDECCWSYWLEMQGDVMSLKKQIGHFEGTTLVELEAELGCGRQESLSRFLCLVGTGGNDYSFNYFLNNPPNSELDTVDSLRAFTSNLTATLTLHLQVGSRTPTALLVHVSDTARCISSLVSRMRYSWNTN